MDANDFLKELEDIAGGFFTGVPDSLLKPLCDCVYNKYGISEKHIIAANEGNAVALAAGYHLSTGKTPVVYMQNSGIGNIVNPVASLLNTKVYGIPCIFIVGWRGEPNVKDEPQHVFQGEVTFDLLDVLDIATTHITKETRHESLQDALKLFKEQLDIGRSVAFVISKGALSYGDTVVYRSVGELSREAIIRKLAYASGDDVVVCTTGKASRELFEIRQSMGMDHSHDFLTVGSMGHASSIALGVALNKPDRTVWCIDGDGAAVMHMGAMAVIGSLAPKNLVHVVINNGAHETVGGMPTVTGTMNLSQIALGCGYDIAQRVSTMDELDSLITAIKGRPKLYLIEAMSSLGARGDLGRPTTTPVENKISFMNYLKGRA